MQFNPTMNGRKIHTHTHIYSHQIYIAKLLNSTDITSSKPKDFKLLVNDLPAPTITITIQVIRHPYNSKETLFLYLI